MRRLSALLVPLLLLGTFSFSVQLAKHTNQLWAQTVYDGPFEGLRTVFLRNLAGVTHDSKGLVAGLAIGDTSALSDTTKEAMKTVSLTHLTAVSGSNCAIVIGIVFLLLGRLPIGRAVRLVLAMVSLFAYILLVGPQPSVLRAGVMTATVLVANAMGRKSSAMSALALCILILLVSDPWLAVNFGFQLSVLATVGILQLAPPIAEKFGSFMPKWFALVLAVSIAAQLMCLPVLLQLQPGLSTYSIPANVLAEPLVAPITVLGMLSCLVGPVLPGLGTLLSWLASLGAWLITQIAVNFSSAPKATLGWPGGAQGIVLSVLVAVAAFIALKSKLQRLRFVSSLSLGLIASAVFGSCTAQQFQAGNWLPKNWSIVSCDVGQGDATVIRSEGQVALIDVGRKPAPVKTCLRRLGINHLNLLVLTHFDLDHVGGLDGALDSTSVDTAIITSYHDDRPAAFITYRKLRAASKRLIAAGTGLSGTLGGFAWKVLSPHLGGAEAEDSNDGSVTMLFQSAKLNVLTLADLGEKGQMRLASESATWLGGGFGGVPLVIKVSHHGSADQYPELYEALKPQVGLFSVGLHNDYGHPTKRTLDLLTRSGAQVFRTDLQGSIAVESTAEGLRVSTSGQG